MPTTTSTRTTAPRRTATQTTKDETVVLTSTVRMDSIAHTIHKHLCNLRNANACMDPNSSLCKSIQDNLMRTSYAVPTAFQGGGSQSQKDQRIEAMAIMLEREALALRNAKSLPGLSVLSPEEIVEEMLALKKEFGELRICTSNTFLAVRTEPITLTCKKHNAEAGFGRFEIRYNWSTIGKEFEGIYCVALEPHWSVHDEEQVTSHPHVRSQRVCLGDTTYNVRLAASEGRLSDLFLLIKAVLCNYNDGSPYIYLHEWDDEYSNCSSCERDDLNENEDGCTCLGCNNTFCTECAERLPNTGNYYCRGCRTECDDCEHWESRGNMSRCVHCDVPHCDDCSTTVSDDKIVCNSCYDDHVCADCKKYSDSIGDEGLCLTCDIAYICACCGDSCNEKMDRTAGEVCNECKQMEEDNAKVDEGEPEDDETNEEEKEAF